MSAVPYENAHLAEVTHIHPADEDFEHIVGQMVARDVDDEVTDPIAAELLGTDVEPLALLNTRALANIPPMEWLIDQHVPAGLLSALWGQGASFKSFVALDWALSVASGSPWQGREVTRGPVIYISGEGASGLYTRIEAWETAHPHADTSHFAVVPHAVRMLDPSDVKRLRKTLSMLKKKPALIVVDTLQRAMAGLGDENSTKDMSQLISTLDRLREEFDCAVLVVHHSGADGERARGNTVLRNSCDAMWKLKRDNADGVTAPTATLYCDKLKDGEEPPAQRLVAVRSADSIILQSQHSSVPTAMRSGMSWSDRPF
jgi:hypothetical protein